VYFGIAIDFAGRRLENLRLDPLCQTQDVDRAMDAGLGGLDGIELVVNRRSRTRQIVNFVDFDIQGKGNVVPQELKARITYQVRDILFGARVKVVDT
jgi:hypothetical protein